MYYLGIDPGAKGGIALLHDTHLELAVDFSKERFLDLMAFLSREQETTRACVERVHSLPHQGVKSTFAFGQSFGWILGALDASEISYQLIEPQRWKKEFTLINADKKKSIAVAKQLFPAAMLIPPGCRTPHDGIAEALLMAEYARRKL